MATPTWKTPLFIRSAPIVVQEEAEAGAQRAAEARVVGSAVAARARSPGLGPAPRPKRAARAKRAERASLTVEALADPSCAKKS